MWLVLALSQVAEAASPALTRAAAVAEAKETLSESLGVPAQDVELLRAQPSQWPDAGLGCPQDGDRPQPGVTAGYRISLRAGGAIHWVHVGAEGARLCPHPRERRLAPGPPARGDELSSGTLDAELAELVAVAQRDLAERVPASEPGADEAEIDPIEAEWVTWSDSSLGCPRPGRMYMQVLQPGARIRFHVDGRVFEYHSGPGREPFLCEKPRRPASLDPRR